MTLCWLFRAISFLFCTFLNISSQLICLRNWTVLFIFGHFFVSFFRTKFFLLTYCWWWWLNWYVLQFQAFDFRTTTRNEPFLQLFHCVYVYPLTVSLSRKRNLFIRVELRKDDADIRKQPLEVVGYIIIF